MKSSLTVVPAAGLLAAVPEVAAVLEPAAAAVVDFAVVVAVLGAGLEVVVAADRVEVAAVLALAEDELRTVENLRH